MPFSYGCYNIFRYILIKASNQITICYREHLLPNNFGLLYF